VNSLANDAVDLRCCYEEAEAVLHILRMARAGEPVQDRDWNRLILCESYRRLHQREAALGAEFTDRSFKDFVLSQALTQKAELLEAAVERWKRMDWVPTAHRALDYLPAGARIRATMIPTIKPKPNSFVCSGASGNLVYLYLDPLATAPQLENTIAHELHHIGLAAFGPIKQRLFEHLGPSVRSAISWLEAFGEGLAMLCAAGGPSIHPCCTRSEQERLWWDRSIENFDADLKQIESFLLDVSKERLSNYQTERMGLGLFGVRGPWYTVGWKMATTVEERCGRASLLPCMLDYRLLLVRYNATALGTTCWTDELLSALGLRV
jgi:hypothetical protein